MAFDRLLERGVTPRLRSPKLRTGRRAAQWLRSIGLSARSWVFKGTRLPVAKVIENLEELSIDEVIEQLDVTREQVAAVLEFEAQSLRASDVPAGAHPI